MKKVILSVAVASLFFACKSSKNASQTSNQSQNTNQQGARQGAGGQGGSRPSTDEVFQKMDTNNDGKISKTEAKGPLANDFNKIDSNNDGFLSRTEVENAPKPQRREGGGGGQGR